MTITRIISLALLSPVLLFGTALSAAQAPTLKALAAMEPGKWEISDPADHGAAETVCLPDEAVLLRSQHRHAMCSQFVIEDSNLSATVHYTCPGAGHGRTQITLETPRRADIDTQGIRDGMPFHLQLEARRTGDCPKSAAR